MNETGGRAEVKAIKQGRETDLMFAFADPVGVKRIPYNPFMESLTLITHVSSVTLTLWRRITNPSQPSF
jgi:hypothetical protein